MVYLNKAPLPTKHPDDSSKKKKQDSKDNSNLFTQTKQSNAQYPVFAQDTHGNNPYIMITGDVGSRLSSNQQSIFVEEKKDSTSQASNPHGKRLFTGFVVTDKSKPTQSKNKSNETPISTANNKDSDSVTNELPGDYLKSQSHQSMLDLFYKVVEDHDIAKTNLSKEQMRIKRKQDELESLINKQIRNGWKDSTPPLQEDTNHAQNSLDSGGEVAGAAVEREDSSDHSQNQYVPEENK